VFADISGEDICYIARTVECLIEGFKANMIPIQTWSNNILYYDCTGERTES